MIIIEDLPLEERRKYIKENGEKTILKNNNKNVYYRIEYTNHYTFVGNMISLLRVETILKVKLLQSTSSYNEFDLTVAENNIKEGFDYLPKEFQPIIKLMAELKNHIVCRIDTFGVVTSVLNTNELKGKWEMLRQQLYENNRETGLLKPDELNKILEAGDKEYSGGESILINEMNQNISYVAFFSGFIKQKKNFTRNYNSYIFTNNDIEVPLLLENEYDDEDTFTYSLVNKSSKIDESRFRKLFLKNYPMLQEVFKKHELDIYILNTVNKESEWLESNRFSFQEMINGETIWTRTLCEIEKLENYG